MKKIDSKSMFLSLVLVMFLIKLIDLIFNPNKIFVGKIATFPFFELISVTILGSLGLLFYRRSDLPDFEKVFGKPVLLSISLGLFLSMILVSLDSFARIGNISVGFPLSILFYIWAMISTEVIIRLFLITFFVWMFSTVVFRDKYKEEVYWISAGLISLIISLGMIFTLLNPEIVVNVPGPLMLALFAVVVFASELVSFKLLKEFGFLSSLIFRFSIYLVWHILWPLVFY